MLLNGTSVPWETWSVGNNSYYQADKFSVQLAVSGLPTGFQRADLSDLADIEVEIRVALDGGAETSLIIGVVDDIDDDYVDGVLTLAGRDHTADFIETKTTEKFQNQTASQIVQTLAGRHGLTADVTDTTTKSGLYYQIDNARLTDESTEWDLICYLAQHESYDVWVTGKTIHFHPSSQTYGDPLAVTYTPATTSNVASGAYTGLKVHRALTLAQDISVIVWSWNHKQKKAFKVQAKATRSEKGSRASGKPQVYTYRLPGLTKEQAIQIAQNKLEELSRHERVIDLDLPGDLTTTARTQIQLSGTQTSFDQLYWIDEIERKLSVDGGFEMTIKAKNHSPQSTVTV